MVIKSLSKYGEMYIIVYIRVFQTGVCNGVLEGLWTSLEKSSLKK